MNLLAQMTWGQWGLAATLIGLCCFLILVVLLQRGRGGGLAGAFGGVGGTSAFGAKTGDVFTVITVIVAFAFVTLSMVGNCVFDVTPTDRARAPTPVSPSLPVEIETAPDTKDAALESPVEGEDQDGPGTETPDTDAGVGSWTEDAPGGG